MFGLIFSLVWPKKFAALSKIEYFPKSKLTFRNPCSYKRLYLWKKYFWASLTHDGTATKESEAKMVPNHLVLNIFPTISFRSQKSLWRSVSCGIEEVHLRPVSISAYFAFHFWSTGSENLSNVADLGFTSDKPIGLTWALKAATKSWDNWR